MNWNLLRFYASNSDFYSGIQELTHILLRISEEKIGGWGLWSWVFFFKKPALLPSNPFLSKVTKVIQKLVWIGPQKIMIAVKKVYWCCRHQTFKSMILVPWLLPWISQWLFPFNGFCHVIEPCVVPSFAKDVPLCFAMRWDLLYVWTQFGNITAAKSLEYRILNIKYRWYFIKRKFVNFYSPK